MKHSMEKNNMQTFICNLLVNVHLLIDSEPYFTVKMDFSYLI